MVSASAPDEVRLVRVLLRTVDGKARRELLSEALAVAGGGAVGECG